MVSLEAFVPAHVNMQNACTSCNSPVSEDGSFIEGGVTISIVQEGLLGSLELGKLVVLSREVS